MHYRTLPIASKFVEGIPEIQAKHDGAWWLLVFVLIRFPSMGEIQ